MKITDNSASMDAFNELCDEVSASHLADMDDCQYWVFERGYRAAIQGLLEIMETGEQTKKFTSPALQAIADKLVTH